jgi:hypothetical protein
MVRIIASSVISLKRETLVQNHFRLGHTISLETIKSSDLGTLTGKIFLAVL